LGDVDGKEWVVKKSRNVRKVDGLSPAFIRELNAMIAIHVLGMGGVHTVNCFGFHIDEEKGKEYIFLEKADGNLYSFLKMGGFTTDKTLIKAVTELFRGLQEIHSIGMMHRDIKSPNILVFRNENGIKLKICDFGLVRGAGEVVANGNAFTDVVCTLWYRPPELLIDSCDGVTYGPSIDVWSMACVVAEMITRNAFLPGKDETEQIRFIARKCGFSDSFCSKYNVPDELKKILLKDAIPEHIPVLKELLKRGLESDPARRITAEEAYKMLLDSPRDPMQIEVLTPPKIK